MKRFFLTVIVYVVLVLICFFVINKIAYAEVPIRYGSKLCKMEIKTTENSKTRKAKDIIEKEVMEFCRDKYIYNIDVTTYNGKYVYIIIYNDKEELCK